ncbi:MAG: FAD-dependent oxidoreductase [Eubacterium sp.]|nr:FAD-dependent oxidoreductase [Eubacterium sp.]
MDQNYAKLFEQTTIGNLTLNNRFVLAPCSTGATLKIDDRMIDYYAERAKGGFGMVILEAQNISSKIDAAGKNNPNNGTPAQWATWFEFNNKVKIGGVKTCIQLAAGPGCMSFILTEPPVCSSEIPAFFDPSITCHALTVEEINKIVEYFAIAATQAKAMGFDAIEIHSHLGYLLDEFMYEYWNKRTDEFGGSFENRMRFPVMIVKAIRQAVGEGFPVIFRLSVEHKYEGCGTVDDAVRIVKALEEAGIDAFDLDVGSYYALDWSTPVEYYGDGCMVSDVRKLKEATDKPILCTGNFTPETAAKAVNDGSVDYVMLGRPAIADADYVNKVYKNQLDDIRPCIRCNRFCIDNYMLGLPVSCSVNTAACDEKYFALTKTVNPKNVAVIGGGPGGMEAARVAALKGHNVHLYEKGDKLGGQLNPASGPQFKGQLRKLMRYLSKQVADHNVNIHYGTEITPDSPELIHADEIIVAMGATPIIPDIPASENANVADVTEIHLGTKKVSGESIVVVGGGMSGCDCAASLAMEGKQVTLVEMMDKVAAKADISHQTALFKIYDQYNVNVICNHAVKQITDDAVIIEGKDGEKETLPADTVITAIGVRPLKSQADAIISAYPHAKIIGDCGRVGLIGDAIREGYKAAWAID